ncbi:cell surface glycoprotein CD200 receptor 1 [Notamacropus eugenii]|uniref:cell surface glycoprotein CD200 receptor 1 n=1 Tax=Notamacropus eugenii TaxID=9315 RepID=UPI003B66F565
MDVNSIWKAFDLMLLTLLISFLVAEYKSTQAVTQVPPSNMSMGQVSHQSLNNASNSVSVQVNTEITLSCFPHPVKDLIMTTWKILLRDKAPCIIAYREDKKETKETNCSGEGVKWESRPEWNHMLQISPVTIDNDGYYTCTFVTPSGNFQTAHHLTVLVPPVVTLSEEELGTVICKAVAGKPAAQISWDPKGDCFTVNDTHDDGTVTVESTCKWNVSNESATCFISHLTGNKSLSIEHQSQSSRSALKYLYVTLPVVSLVILAIVGLFICKKSNGCRTCKSSKPEAATPGIREDELEPYASYTEKSNPLYDARTEVKISTAS